MAIPRRYLFIAAGAAAAAGFMYVRNKMDERSRKEREDSRARDRRPSPGPAKAEPAEGESGDERAAERADMTGGVRELSEFLAGDSWFDEPGWKSIWSKENIEDPAAWLKGDGLGVLKDERTKLSDHPALLAGCRRRWIVVARYAGIDVGDAANLWNEVDA
jgi:hypothetical protein